MAIIQAPGGGWELLVETLLRKEQIGQAKEDLKLRQADFKLKQETWMAEQQRRKGEEESAMLMLESLGRNLGIDPTAAPSMLANIQQQQQIDATTALQGAQTNLVGAQIDNFAVQADLDKARLALETRRTDIAEIADENERRFREAQLNLDERRLTSQESMNRQQLASQEWQTALQLGAASPQGLMGFLQEAYGEFTSPQDIQARLEGGEVEMTPKARITRFFTGMGITPETQNTINEALFVDGVEPQAVLESIVSNPEIDDQSKAQLTMALMSVFQGMQLPPPPPEDPGMWARIFKFLGGAGGSMRVGPAASGVRQSPTGA